MPVIESTERKVDVDAIARDVVTMGLKMVTHGYDTGFHRHRKAQCVMAVAGVLTCEAAGGLWIVPPQNAVWVPAGVEHRITLAGSVEGLQRLHRARRRGKTSLRLLYDRRDATAARAPRPHRAIPDRCSRRGDRIAGGGAAARRDRDGRGGRDASPDATGRAAARSLSEHHGKPSRPRDARVMGQAACDE